MMVGMPMRPHRRLATIGALALTVALVGCQEDESGPLPEGTDPPPPAATDPAQSPPPEGPGEGVGEDAGQFGGAEGPVAPAADASIPEIVEQVRPSVVAVQHGEGLGSGVVWDADGHIVTNHHVIAGATDVTVRLADGRRFEAEIVASDERSDLAVLRIGQAGLAPAAFAEELPDVGSLTIAIGDPLGFEGSVTAGILSGVGRSLPGAAQQAPALIDLLQTDAAISPGNSGGALVGADGRVIGINVAHIPPAARAVAIGFAIPAPTVIDVVGQLLEDGEVVHAYMGIAPATVTPQVAERLGLDRDRGAAILEMDPDGPAADAGMAPGDIVVEAGGEPVDTAESLIALARRAGPGATLEMVVVREGDEMTVDVVIGEFPGP
jgi:serine protease DegQ